MFCDKLLHQTSQTFNADKLGVDTTSWRDVRGFQMRPFFYVIQSDQTVICTQALSNSLFVIFVG